MKSFYCLLFSFFFTLFCFGQVKNNYTISFDNVAHREAKISASFTNLESGKVILKFAQKSPGSFGCYDFSKYLYGLTFTDKSGKEIKAIQSKLNEWEIQRHGGTINVNYNLFGDMPDGIFSQISENQVIINNPSAFIYVPKLASRPVKLSVNNRSDLGWKIATQLKKTSSSQFEAENLDEFMDSFVFLADFNVVEKPVEVNGQQINLKLVVNGGNEVTEELAEKIAKIATEEHSVFGSFPDYNNETYTFVISFKPYNTKNEIEHKHSSLILSSNDPESINTESIVQSMAELFVKSWNKKRIRPNSLKPFDLQESKLTREYWFTEGFSRYYALIGMVRSGVISEDKFLEKTSYIINNVITSGALKHNTLYQMSEKSSYYVNDTKQSNSIDLNNLYIPYEDHGFVIALLLDLELRNKDKDYNLDEFMNLMWAKYGRTGIGYTHENIYGTIREFAGDSFAESFYKKNIYEVERFEFQKLFESVGVSMTYIELPYVGAEIEFDDENQAVISKYTYPGSPAYESGLEKGDIIHTINKRSFTNKSNLKNTIDQAKIGKKVGIKFERFGVKKSTELRFIPNPKILLNSMLKIDDSAAELKNKWIKQ